MGTQFYVVIPGQANYGPATLDELVKWAEEGRIPGFAKLQDANTGQIFDLRSFPELASRINLPQSGGSIGSRLIPNNSNALLSYYIGIFSIVGYFFCIPGPIMSLAAVVLGYFGLRDYKNNPWKGGRTHSWVGIILGVLGLLATSGLLILFLIGNV